MALYRKKPVVVEAFQLPSLEDPPEDFLDWADSVGFTEFYSDYDGGILVCTLEGDMRANPLDYIIKGVRGEFYPCKPDIFEVTYEAVKE